MVRADLPEPIAHRLVATRFEARSDIAIEAPAAALLDRARATFTDPVPLHP